MIKAYAKSDIGKVREINEDSYYISDSLDELQLYILADGMGGYNGGDIASKLAIQSIKSYIENNFNQIEKDKASIIQLVGSSIEYANMLIYEKAKKNKELQKMGTTIEVCLIYNNRVYIGHIGDSRIYRIRNDIIRKLTQDHSYVQKLVKDGTITKEQAVNHPQKNMLMKALGCGSFVEPDVMVKGFMKQDILVMASDGLTNQVEKEEICRSAKINIEQATKDLVKIANDNGGYDNITVIIIKNI